ncbi:N-acetylmuramoyl-L-alanine amidase [Bulleidia sp. zg-1006]|uniref:N-acetylmuramoyl-L-alanine amidase n=1 Tax=Bulleidia sp. zg-1006 TaxID=2806552 RepID=UPI00193A8D32|nr:N-acetylmuramoyl-L-alanine amidase [Bulleidia sp. zg-1006]QRG86365.1 N-acetylmuramoyl-L-alanine amidase [Bulleidia sp. zg-1006]
MSYSALTNKVILSPNHSGRRNQPVSKITIHHMAGNLSIETCGNVFKPKSRKASSNYGIGSDGRIACYVEEENRAWTSSSPWNDHRAITIEVANNEIGGKWNISDKAYSSLIKLCFDICKRYNINPYYDGTKNATLTEHRMFAATACPGETIHNLLAGHKIENDIKKSLVVEKPKPAPAQPAQKSLNEVAREVIQGKWGNGAERKAKLEKAGYNYNTIQSLVNELVRGNRSATPSKSIDQIAREVIQGKWGNGAERKERLTKAGYDYNAVQRRVNQLL